VPLLEQEPPLPPPRPFQSGGSAPPSRHLHFPRRPSRQRNRYDQALGPAEGRLLRRCHHCLTPTLVQEGHRPEHRHRRARNRPLQNQQVRLAQRRGTQIHRRRDPEGQRHDGADDVDSGGATSCQLRHWGALRAPLRFRQGTIFPMF
jgi:hypothetical protein